MTRWSIASGLLVAGLLAPAGATGCTGAERGTEQAGAGQAEIVEAPTIPGGEPPVDGAPPEGEAEPADAQTAPAELPDVAAPAEEEGDGAAPEPAEPAS